VADVRIKGGIGVLELDQPVDMAAITRRFVDKGVWIRPFGKLVYVMPPYIIGDEELDTLLMAMTEAVLEELS
jgi:adenosylmethionine-8-amino-7-oxononanoate aminotransferase